MRIVINSNCSLLMSKSSASRGVSFHFNKKTSKKQNHQSLDKNDIQPPSPQNKPTYTQRASQYYYPKKSSPPPNLCRVLFVLKKNVFVFVFFLSQTFSCRHRQSQNRCRRPPTLPLHTSLPLPSRRPGPAGACRQCLQTPTT